MKSTKNMKKMIITIVAVVMMINIIPIGVFADSGGVIASGKLGEKIDWVLYQDGNLEVTGKGATDIVYFDSEIHNYNDQVKSITIGEGITEIRDGVFQDFVNASGTLIVPSTVKKIDRYAFLGCGFSEVLLPNGLESIDVQAFQNNKNLVRINIPDELKSLGKSVFDGCENLAEITSGNSCKNFTVRDNVLFDKSMSTLVLYPQGLTVKSYTVPAGVKKIERMNDQDLENINLPDGVEELGYAAFSRNKNMKSIILPSSLKTIGESAFQSCSKLESIELPESLELVDYDAFLYCGALKKVTFLSKDCKLNNMALNRNTVIAGYEDSTAHDYAETLGYEFHDIDNDSIVTERMTNDKFITMLPLTGIETSVPMTSFGNQINIDPGYADVTEDLRQEIARKVTEITSGCDTDYAKAKAIYGFVNKHLTYKWGYNCNLLGAWEGGIGNCETYALLTSTMLYDAGIPYAYAYTVDHVFNLALCEGRWVDIDSQGIFDRGGNVHPDITSVLFRSGDITYVLDNSKGIKMAGIGDHYSETDKRIMKNGIDVPDWVAGAYKRAVNAYDGIVIRGSEGKGAEKAADMLGYKCKTGSGSQFTAYKDHDHDVVEVLKKAKQDTDGQSVCKCRRCETVETVTFPGISYCVPDSWEHKYTGKAIKPVMTIRDTSRKDISPKYYTISYKYNTNPGRATVIIKFKGAYSGTEKCQFTILKLKNTMKVSDAKKTVKAGSIRKKAKSFAASKVIKVKHAKGTVKYSKVSGTGKISIKNGKIVIRKGTKKGTYTIKVKVRANGNIYYKARKQEVKLTVNVR